MFHFRFETILKHKSLIQKQKQKEMLALLSEYNKIQNALHAARKSLSQLSNLMKDNVTDLLYMRSQSVQIGYLENIVFRMLEKIRTLEGPLNEKRTAYLKAKQEEETFQFMKEKEYEIFLQEKKKKEIKNWEEIGLWMWRSGDIRDFDIS